MSRVTEGRSAAVLLHGFTQTGRCLGPIAEWLGLHREVFTPDLPGHGSAAALADMDCPTAAAHLTSGIGAAGAVPAHWVGYSLGARVALHVALGNPRSVRSLVLIGGTAGIEDPTERERRRVVDLARAAELETTGVTEFVDRWLDMEMFAGLPERARFVDERRANTSTGLAGSLRSAGTGSMTPLWGRLGELEMPVLLLSGEADHAYGALAERMAARTGDNATALSVLGAGHAAHLEAPELVFTMIEDHLCSADP